MKLKLTIPRPTHKRYPTTFSPSTSQHKELKAQHSIVNANITARNTHHAITARKFPALILLAVLAEAVGLLSESQRLTQRHLSKKLGETVTGVDA